MSGYPWPRLAIPSVEDYKAFCETKGWVYIARFIHPMSDQDRERYEAIRPPKKMFLRCTLWGKKSEGSVEDVCAEPKPVLKDDERPGFLTGRSYVKLGSHQRYDGDSLGENHYYRKEYPWLVSDMKDAIRTDHPDKPVAPKKKRQRKPKKAAA